MANQRLRPKNLLPKVFIQRHKEFRKALEQGTIIIHPSTSTVFVYEEIIGEKPEGLWFCGAVTTKGYLYQQRI